MITITETEYAFLVNAAQEKIARMKLVLFEKEQRKEPAKEQSEQPAAVEEAPYGFKADGTPKKAPGRPRKAKRISKAAKQA